MVKRIHKSARGVTLDFDLMQHQNKEVVALGNANMNANGDIIGRGGEIIRKVDDIPTELAADSNAAYNQDNPKSTRKISLKEKIDEFKEVAPIVVVDKVEVLETGVTELVQEKPKQKTKIKRKIVDSRG